MIQARRLHRGREGEVPDEWMEATETRYFLSIESNLMPLNHIMTHGRRVPAAELMITDKPSHERLVRVHKQLVRSLEGQRLEHRVAAKVQRLRLATAPGPGNAPVRSTENTGDGA